MLDHVRTASAPTLRRVGASVASLAATGACLVAVAIGAAGPALAHASLVRIEPADGSAVTAAPEQVRLVFDEKMSRPATVVVTGPDGGPVQRGQAEVVDNTATVAVAVKEPGTYTVAFRVVSADGHPVAGQTTFAYRAAVSPAASRTAAAAGHARHDAASNSGFSSGRIVGIFAVAALLGGLALLTVRRLPGGMANPRGTDSRDSAR